MTDENPQQVPSKPDEIKRGLLVGAMSILGLYGLFLFGAQVYYFLSDGVWVPLPASYIVAKPEQLQAMEILENEALQQDPEKIYENSKRLEIFAKLKPYVIRFNSDGNSWFDAPKSWIGLHGILMGLLNILSIPFISMMISFLVLIRTDV